MTLSKEELNFEKRKENAIEIALSYGVYDGNHHKQWVIDQMLQAICTEEEYKQIIIDYPDWEKGVAP
jgi:hypothetical protein